MKNAAVLLGVAMLAGGLVCLFLGLLSLVAAPCFIGEDCAPAPDNIALFPVGLIGVILGSILWTAAAGSGTDGSTRNPLAKVGFFGIFGLSFFGLGAAMFIADRQPNVDHTTNVLTILGIIFGVVGLASIGLEIASRLNMAADARILATGIRGRAVVTAVHDTNVTVNLNPMIAMDLRVEVPGQPVFTKTVRQVISRLDVASYKPGIVLAVAANPAKPQDIAIDWDNSPIVDATAATDPVTGRPIVDGAPGTAPAVAATGVNASPVDVAAILRSAADQIAAGGTASHPAVASAASTSHQWSATGQPMSPDEVARILRTAAAQVSAGGTPTVVSSGSMASGDLAALLRQASAAAARAADAAETGTLPGTSATG